MSSEENKRDLTKQETRRALIAAAMAEFVEHGFDTPSLDAISARAGYTRGAFYVHFKDRDALVVAVMETVLGEFLDAILAVDTDGDDSDLEATVFRFANALAQGNQVTGESGSMRTHHLLEVCARSPLIRERFLEMIGEAERRVAEATRAAQAAGTVRTDTDANAVAAILSSLAMGVVQMFELGVPVNLDAMRATVLTLLAPRR